MIQVPLCKAGSPRAGRPLIRSDGLDGLTVRAVAASSRVARSRCRLHDSDVVVATQAAHGAPTWSSHCRAPSSCWLGQGDRLVRHLPRQDTAGHQIDLNRGTPAMLQLRFFLTLRAEWSPPCQRITRSSALSSTRTTISSISVRTIRFRVSGATPALDLIRLQGRYLALSAAPCRQVRRSVGEAVRPPARSPHLAHDRLPVDCFSSSATRRLLGSTASYWRRARPTS